VGNASDDRSRGHVSERQTADGNGRILTGGEAKIASLAARGRRNDEIAHELDLSPKTVEWNRTRVYRKLGVRSRTELAVQLNTGDTPWASEEPK
jgi:DNA-binding NarL/FixJ family response regulator